MGTSLSSVMINSGISFFKIQIGFIHFGINILRSAGSLHLNLGIY